jgi:7,8-dihydropterin-6-yl-methyl-4-(beta-D-ribofuranosyl)aminobenzene 5'-phosphate synthase
MLFAGCAHKGIVNILERAEQLVGAKMNKVIAGMHLYNPVSKASEDAEVVNQIALELLKSSAKYYTCHCTGTKAFAQLHEVMKDRIAYLATGSRIQL